MTPEQILVGQNRYRRLGNSVLWQVWGYNDEHWFTIGRDESDVLTALEKQRETIAKLEAENKRMKGALEWYRDATLDEIVNDGKPYVAEQALQEQNDDS